MYMHMQLSLPCHDRTNRRTRTRGDCISNSESCVLDTYVYVYAPAGSWHAASCSEHDSVRHCPVHAREASSTLSATLDFTGHHWPLQLLAEACIAAVDGIEFESMASTTQPIESVFPTTYVD